MNAPQTVVLGLGLVVTLAALTVVLLRSSFRRLLVELCRNENHGRFWLAFACLAIVLTSLFGALTSIPTADPSLWRESPHLHILIASLRTGLLGLLLSLAGVALALLVSIGQRGLAPSEFGSGPQTREG